MNKFAVLGIAFTIAGGLHAAVVEEAQVDPLQKQGRTSGPVVHTPSATEVRGQAYLDSYYQRKLGRVTPTEQVRLDEERASAAFRAEPAATAQPYVDRYMRAKIGRTN